jgi:hypothetical protein
MTRNDLQILDTIETPEYIKGELSDDGSVALSSPTDHQPNLRKA